MIQVSVPSQWSESTIQVSVSSQWSESMIRVSDLGPLTLSATQIGLAAGRVSDSNRACRRLSQWLGSGLVRVTACASLGLSHLSQRMGGAQVVRGWLSRQRRRWLLEVGRRRQQAEDAAAAVSRAADGALSQPRHERDGHWGLGRGLGRTVADRGCGQLRPAPRPHCDGGGERGGGTGGGRRGERRGHWQRSKRPRRRHLGRAGAGYRGYEQAAQTGGGGGVKTSELGGHCSSRNAQACLKTPTDVPGAGAAPAGGPQAAGGAAG